MSLSLPAWTADVALAGLLPNRALVSIDGGVPRSLAVGASANGVKLVALEDGAAVFEIEGKRKRIALGSGAGVSAGTGTPGGAKVTLTADSRGHFVTHGSVNGATVRFLLDTGATSVALGAADAIRANLDFRKGKPVTTMTANGTARAWVMTLHTVKVGEVTLNEVEATVMEHDMPVALLGMSFLNRVEMKRDGVTMTLTKRY